MIDQKAFVGKRFGTWTVLSRAENDRKSNHRWLCRCECGTERILLGMNLKKAKSCGCKRAGPLFEDMTGEKCGKWIVVSRAENSDLNQARWSCVCECGVKRIVIGGDLRSGASQSCGQCGDQKNQLIDLTGKRIERWTVIRLADSYEPKNVRWECLCDCGERREVLAHNLLQGESKSCGCLASDVTTQRSTKHGHSPREGFSPTYSSWVSMMSRCYIPGAGGFERYGAVGIKVCVRWHTFENFLADMGERPSGKTLDRLNNWLGYFSANTRWATASEQARNRRPNGTAPIASPEEVEKFKGRNLRLEG